MTNRLVVNGCSYMKAYTYGNGHSDLADRLKISSAVDLSQSGCANSRMIRTTLKDSFQTDSPTLYIIGLTFISRSEVPILKIPAGNTEENSFEGRWTNPQNQIFKDMWEQYWSEKDTDLFMELKLKEELMSLLDRTEDLMYRLVSMIDSLTSRNHKVLLYQQADTDYFKYLNYPRLQLFKQYPNFINGLQWCAIQWQHENGVAVNPGDYNNKYGTVPENIRHRKSGNHQILNEYLTQYIKDNKILE